MLDGVSGLVCVRGEGIRPKNDRSRCTRHCTDRVHIVSIYQTYFPNEVPGWGH